MKGDKTFIDTNIIIYAYDISAGEKHKIANKIINDIWRSGLGVLSTQVLQEFFVAVTTKIPKPLDVQVTKEIISDYLKWDVIVNDGEVILGAIQIHLQYQYSFRDSLIINAAKKGGVSLLLTEDLSDGQIIDDITIKNPFLDHLQYK